MDESQLIWVGAGALFIIVFGSAALWLAYVAEENKRKGPYEVRTDDGDSKRFASEEGAARHAFHWITYGGEKATVYLEGKPIKEFVKGHAS